MEEIMKRIDEKQQQAFDLFFKEETTWFPEYVVMKFISLLLAGISFILIIFPYASQKGESLYTILLPYIIYAIGIFCYQSRFSTYYGKKEIGSEAKSLSGILRYLPVNREQLFLFKLRKAGRLCLILTLLAMLLKTIFSIAFYHTFSIYDMLFPICFNLLLPVILMRISTP